jgi:parallel beta-helix repeat protein
MKKLSLSHVLLLVLLCQTLFAQTPYTSAKKKILEFGWDIPNYDYVADNITSMEYAPFDGVVFDMRIPKRPGVRRAWSVCNPDEVKESDFDFTKLPKITSNKLTDNFVRVFMQDDYDQVKFGWFNDTVWSNIKKSTKLLSKVVKLSKSKGVFLDTEEYGGLVNPWEYTTTAYPNQTSQQVYDKVRQRGREYMTELQTEVPNIKVMYTFAYDFIENWGNGSYYAQKYALLKPFLDGMLEAAGPQVILIDGNEATYFTDKNEDYTWWYDQVKMQYVKDRIPTELIAKYKKQYRAAYSPIVNRYFDVPYGQAGYDFNFDLPLATQKKWLEHAIYNRLLNSDEYVWTWSQGDVQWWNGTNFKNKQDWADAVVAAKAKLNSGQALGYTMSYSGNKLKADLSYSAVTATMVYPTHNATIPAGEVTFKVQFNDATKNNYQYFYINGISKGYTLNDTTKLNLTDGIYTAYVFGYDKENKSYQSNPVTFTVGSPTVNTGIYYVSPTGTDAADAGTIAKPFKTLAYTCTKVPANQGNTIQLAEGTYIETAFSQVPTGVNIKGAGMDKTILKAASNLYYSYNPADNNYFTNRFLLQFTSNNRENGNQNITDLMIDGDEKKLHGAIMVQNRDKIKVSNCKIQNTGFSGIWLWGTDGSEVSNSTIIDASWGNQDFQTGNINLGNVSNTNLFGLTLRSYKYQNVAGFGYGIKAIGPNSNDALLKNVKLYNSTVDVSRFGTWQINGNPTPNISVEFHNTKIENCEVTNVTVNNNMSFVQDNTVGGTAINLKVKDCRFNLQPDAGTTDQRGYCLELAMDNAEVANCYFNGGWQGIANFGRKVSNWKIHHNVFENQRYKYIANALRFQNYAGNNSGIDNLEFYHNTIITDGLTKNEENTLTAIDAISVIGQNSACTNWQIKNNIFKRNNPQPNSAYLYRPTGLFNLENGATVSNANVSYNLFDQFPIGAQNGVSYSNNLEKPSAMNENGTKPNPFFTLTQNSAAVNAGANLGFPLQGNAPDLGAYESTFNSSTSDTQAPTAPSNVIANNITTTSFGLTWAASTDNVGVKEYEIFINNASIGKSVTTTFNVTNRTASTSYGVIVKAIDIAGNVSLSSPVLTVKTATAADIQAPTAPNNVIANNITTTSFGLTWAASTDNVGVKEYEIFINNASIGKSATTTFNVTNRTPSTSYGVTIKAIDIAGNVSLSSPVLTVVTATAADTQAPTAPSNVIANNITTTSFGLTWTASTDNVGVKEYEIFINNASIGKSVTTAFNVTNRTASTSYGVTVKAIDIAGNVSLSSPVLTVKTATAADIQARNIIDFANQPAGFVPLNPNKYTNVDKQGADAFFTNFNAYDGVISDQTFADNSPSGNNRMAQITNNYAILNFTKAVKVPSFYVNTLTYGANTGWKVEGTLNGVVQFSFNFNYTFPYSKWGQVTAGNDKTVDKLIFTNAKDCGIDDIKIEAAADTQAPTTPTTLNATDITTSSFVLNWTASTDNVAVTKYLIYKDFKLVKTVSSSVLYTNIDSLSSNTTYSMIVRAVDAAGNLSNPTLPLLVKTLTTQVNNKLITFSEQAAGMKALSPYFYNNVDNNGATAYFSNFSSSDGLITTPIFDDKTVAGPNRIGMIASNYSTVYFSKPVTVPSFWVNTLVYGANTGWKVEGTLNGITQFTFTFNYTFPYAQWGQVTAGNGKTVDKLIFTNAKDCGIDDILIEAANGLSSPPAPPAPLNTTLITFTEQGAGFKGLNPYFYRKVDNQNTNAYFADFYSTDGVGANTIIEDKTISGANRMAVAQTNTAEILFTQPAIVPSFWINPSNTSWSVTGYLNGIVAFTFSANSSFSYGKWSEVTAGKDIVIDKLIFTNAKNCGLDDIRIEAAINLAPLRPGNNAFAAPNPIQDITNITFTNNNADPTLIQIIDYYGKVYTSQTIESIVGENSFQLDTSNIPSGLYILSINRRSGNESLKVSIQH